MIKANFGPNDVTVRAILAMATIAVALLSGWGVAWGGWVIAVALVGILALGLLALQGPYTVLFVWMILSPVTQGRVISLGGVPDISADLVLVLMAFLLVLIQILTKTRMLRRWRMEDTCLLAFLGWGVVSILIRPVDPTKQLWGLFQQFALPIIVYWVVYQTVISEKELRQILFLQLVILIIISLPAPVEEITRANYIGNPKLFGMNVQVAAGVVRVRSFYGSPWEFGAVAAMLLSLSTHVGYSNSGSWRKRFGIAAIFLGSVAVALSFMRAAWISAVAVLILTGVSNPRLRRWFYPILALAAIIILANWSVIVETDTWTSRIVSPENLLGRVTILQQQLQIAGQNLLTGRGVSATTELFYTPGGGVIGASHNMYLSILIDWGLWGFLYFAAIALIVKKSIPVYHYLPSSAFVGKDLMVALWLTVAVFLMQALSMDTRMTIPVQILCWQTLGLLRAVEEVTKKDEQGVPI